MAQTKLAKRFADVRCCRRRSRRRIASHTCVRAMSLSPYYVHSTTVHGEHPWDLIAAPFTVNREDGSRKDAQPECKSISLSSLNTAIANTQCSQTRKTCARDPHRAAACHQFLQASPIPSCNTPANQTGSATMILRLPMRCDMSRSAVTAESLQLPFWPWPDLPIAASFLPFTLQCQAPPLGLFCLALDRVCRRTWARVTREGICIKINLALHVILYHDRLVFVSPFAFPNSWACLLPRTSSLCPGFAPIPPLPTPIIKSAIRQFSRRAQAPKQWKSTSICRRSTTTTMCLGPGPMARYPRPRGRALIKTGMNWQELESNKC